jgi:hypothetical protein
MPKVLMIGVAFWAGLIMVAAWVMVMQWRSGGQPSMSVRDWRAVVARLVDAGMARRLPGRHPEIVQQGRLATASAELAVPQVSGVADAEPGSNRPGAQADQQQAGAEVITVSERIARFYEEADRPVADFLMALGWTGAPDAGPLKRNAGTDGVPGNGDEAQDGAPRPGQDHCFPAVLVADEAERLGRGSGSAIGV